MFALPVLRFLRLLLLNSLAPIRVYPRALGSPKSDAGGSVVEFPLRALASLLFKPLSPLVQIRAIRVPSLFNLVPAQNMHKNWLTPPALVILCPRDGHKPFAGGPSARSTHRFPFLCLPTLPARREAGHPLHASRPCPSACTCRAEIG